MPGTDWITCLTLRGVACSRSALIGLSELKNLSILVIWSKEKKRSSELTRSSIDYRVENKIIRAWSDAALEASAFSKLRILALINQSHFTELTFTYLTLLPSLYKFFTSVPGSDKAAALQQENLAAKHGWTVGGWMRWHGREFQGSDLPGVLGARPPMPGPAETARGDQTLPVLQYLLQGPKYKSSVMVRSFRRQPSSATSLSTLGKRRAPLTEANPRCVKASKRADTRTPQAFLEILASRPARVADATQRSQ